MQNFHVVSRAFQALSSGALLFAVSLIFCTGKIFTEAVFAFNLQLQYIGLNLQNNQVHHSKEPKILV
jgi:hypothetical protein